MTGSDCRADRLIRRAESLLVVIDAQERLLPVIDGQEAVVENIVRLVRFARIIGLPMVVTEQDKLGATVEPISSQLAVYEPIPKATFDSFGCLQFKDRLAQMAPQNLVLAGVEAHICVAQTALAGLEEYNIHVVSAAVSSRNPANRQVALNRLARAGAVITSTEMVIYELMVQAGTDEFRSVLPLVK